MVTPQAAPAKPKVGKGTKAAEIPVLIKIKIKVARRRNFCLPRPSATGIKRLFIIIKGSAGRRNGRYLRAEVVLYRIRDNGFP